MAEKGISPNLETHNTLIYGYGRMGLFDRCFQILEEMEYHGMKPNVVSYGSLINCLCKDGKLLEAEIVLRDMEDRWVSPNTQIYNMLIDGTCSVGRIKDAFKFFDEMVESKIAPTLVTYNVLINGLCKKTRIMEAEDLLNQIISTGPSPDVITYNSLISGLVFSYKLAEKAIVEVLITLFTDSQLSAEPKQHSLRFDIVYDLRYAAAFVNSLVGLSALMLVFLIYISEAFGGGHLNRIIVWVAVAYEGGLAILVIAISHVWSESYIDSLIIIIGLILVALGRGGLLDLAEEFTYEQLEAHEPDRQNINKKRVRARENKWSLFASAAGSLVAIPIYKISWNRRLITIVGVMCITYLLFILATPLYHKKDQAAATSARIAEKPFTPFTCIRVLWAALLKRHEPNPFSPDRFFHHNNDGFFRNNNDELELWPQTKLLSFVRVRHRKTVNARGASLRLDHREVGMDMKAKSIQGVDDLVRTQKILSIDLTKRSWRGLLEEGSLRRSSLWSYTTFAQSGSSISNLIDERCKKSFQESCLTISSNLKLKKEVEDTKSKAEKALKDASEKFAKVEREIARLRASLKSSKEKAS
ncbi:hypothetical protein LWI29_033616 [Acer saccharum]|uniref:Pentatricopeptide repeat-containing protein n=1 Tax=Acer saccharum TaxID=4024 RepID=A0AA39SM98_ACESA|nr:hypothetical protein LWI29_033616 [Acer saccharum]